LAYLILKREPESGPVAVVVCAAFFAGEILSSGVIWFNSGLFPSWSRLSSYQDVVSK
jgi:hypothetical protein